MNQEHHFLRFVQSLYRCTTVILTMTILLISGICILQFSQKVASADAQAQGATVETKIKKPFLWSAPDSLLIPHTPEGDLIRYGNSLVAHTALYLGPRGSVSQTTNGMNCQNCHLKAGKKLFGNNYSAVSPTYPKYRARSGTVETIEKRINDCIERSLNGQPLKAGSRELQAISAYILWVGHEVEKSVTPYGAGIWDLPYLDRAASPEKGKIVFIKHCARCHGKNGQGIKSENNHEWKYPPLWGPASYNTAAGLFRLSRFAGYVKANMPNGATFNNPVLTDEEAWDVAAYVNSMPRPQKIFPGDWPDVSTKPFDHPFGPYADTFSERQHKFGPFSQLKRKK